MMHLEERGCSVYDTELGTVRRTCNRPRLALSSLRSNLHVGRGSATAVGWGGHGQEKATMSPQPALDYAGWEPCGKRWPTSAADLGWQRFRLFHEQSLPRAFYCFCKAPLIVRGQAGVFTRQNSPGFGNELGEQGGILEIEHIDGEIDFWLGPRCADFTGVGCSGWTIRMSFSWHNNLRGSIAHLTSL